MADNVLKAVIDVTAPNAVQTFNQVAVATGKTEIALKKLPQAANQSTQALTNLGRVVQDAPFGFLGIANNLNPLLESFQRLQTTTGSTGAALKSLGSSLIGAGGLGFGLSLVSSALIVFGDKLFGGATASKEAERALQDYKDVVDATVKSLEDLGKAVQFLNQLASLNAQGLGLPELLDLQGAALSQQQLLFDLRASRQKFIEDNKDLDAEDEDRQKKYADGLAKIDEQIKKSEGDLNIVRANIRVQRKKDQDKADADALRAYKEYLHRLKELAEFEAGLFKGLAEGLKAVRDIFQRDIKADQKLRLGVVLDINKDTLATNFANEQQISSQLQKRIDQLTKSNPILILANTKIELTPDEKALQESLKNINQIIQSAAADSIAAISEGIGEAFAGGDLVDGLNGFATIIADALINIGKQMILLSPVIAALKEAIKTLDPVVLLAAGAGLIIIGAALKKTISNNTQGFAEGGYTGDGGKYAPAGIVHKGEFVIPAHSVNRLGVGFLSNLAFGNGIRGYANGGLVGAGISGGGIAIEVTGQTITKGQDIVTVYKAALRSQSRLT